MNKRSIFCLILQIGEYAFLQVRRIRGRSFEGLTFLGGHTLTDLPDSGLYAVYIRLHLYVLNGKNITLQNN